MKRHLVRLIVAAAALAVTVTSLSLSVSAQAPQKKPIGYDMVDYWRTIGGTRLSDDGQWLAYATSAQAEDGELIVRNLASGKEFRHPRGSAPNFTPDGKFVLFMILPPKTDSDEEAGRAGGAGAAGGEGETGGAAAANRNAAGIMALPSGQVTTVEQISTILLAPESSTWVALHKGRAPAAGGRGGRGGRAGGGQVAAGGGAAGGGQVAAGGGQVAAGGGEAAPAGRGAATPPEKRKDPGSDLIIRNLTTGQDVTIAEVVADFRWSKGGAWLAYGVSSTDAAKDGAFARQMSDGTTRTLHAGKGNYKRFAFDEAGSQLAFLSDQAEYDKPVSPYRLYYWKTGDAAAAELVSGATRGVPAGMVVHDSAVSFSKDGKQLYLNTAPPPPPPADPNAKRPISVDLWHYEDAQLQPMQRVRATQERNRNYRAVVHVADKRFVQLATPDLPTVSTGSHPERAVGTSDLPYQQFVSWDQSYSDVYIVDLKTGQRRKILEKAAGGAALSPGGNYLTYFDEFTGHWYSYRVSDGLKVNLTERIPVKFAQEDHDTPDMPGAYGRAGWTEGDRAFWIYDQFDIWEVRPDGSNARMITNGEGRKQNLEFRFQSFDPDFEAQQPVIPATGQVWLSTRDVQTKATGFYRVAASGAAPTKVVMMDKRFAGVAKAKHADRFVYTLSRFEEFPNLWVSDGTFTNMQKVSDANPQQAQYVWGKSELVNYINADGVPLRAILTKPENFDPSKKYPMMVYIYEGLTDGLHTFGTPNVGTSVNIARYVSNGYIVLQPDIIYSTGFPGEAAEKCVIPAVNTIVAQGYIDPKRIGIQGHSWGGYQITHLITRTNLFAAVQAGASVSNMISAYGGIRWGTGMVRQFQYEKTQSRIGAPPWDKTLEFIENSPIFWVEKVQTPYLSIHNDADDAVPWYQGIEFFVAMRRLGKEAYMFNYNGELHGLRNRDNMKHWTVHQDEFFDHYLLGKPKPDWMEKGVSFLERGTRDVSGMFKRATPPPAAGKLEAGPSGPAPRMEAGPSGPAPKLEAGPSGPARR